MCFYLTAEEGHAQDGGADGDPEDALAASGGGERHAEGAQQQPGDGARKVGEQTDGGVLAGATRATQPARADLSG